MSDWDIRARSDQCLSCETPFEDGQECVSLLAYTEQGYVRSDHCAVCWERGENLPQPISMWRGVFRLPPPPPPEPLKKETAEGLLRELMQKSPEANADVIYILAVMLERKRQFTERGTQTRDDGSLLRIYECRRTGETFVVRDPKLSLDELEPVQERVVAMLTPVATPETDATSEASDTPTAAVTP